MDIYKYAMALFQLPYIDWVCQEEPMEETRESLRPRPETIVKREKKRQETLDQFKQQKPSLPPEDTLVYREAAVIDQFRSWSSCTVPLTVVANKEIYADGHLKTCLLIDTKEIEDPTQASEEYHLQTTIEE